MPEAEQQSWWSRPCGVRDVLAIALPLVVSTASWTVMNFIDRMFLFWHHPDAMAAAMPAGMLHFAFLSFPLGVCLYVNTFVAQYHGAKRDRRIGAILSQGLWVAALFTPPFLMLIPFGPALFGWAGHSANLVEYETTYYQMIALAAPAQLVCAVWSGFFIGRGKTAVVMGVNIYAAIANIFLDWLLIFGQLGLPELGIQGAGLATVLSIWSKAALFAWLVYRPRAVVRYRLVQWKPDLAMMRRLLYFGGANGLQFLIDIVGFAAFTLLIGTLGEHALTTTTLAFNVNSVAFVPMLGVGVAISTLVGQQQGAGRSDLAARATWTGVWMGLLYTGFFGLFYLLTPDLFLLGHKAGSAGGDFVSVRETVVVLLRFVAAYCLFDALNIVFSGAIKGAGDTRFVLIVSAITSPTPVVIGAYGVTQLGWGLIECWWIVTLWITTLGVTYMLRFLQGRWRTMTVIEPDVQTVLPHEMQQPVELEPEPA